MQAVEPQCQRTAPGMFVLLGPTASSGVGGPGSLFEEQALESASFSKNFFNFFLSKVNLFFFFSPPSKPLKGLISVKSNCS